MRYVRPVIGISVLFLLAGCSNFRFNFLDREKNAQRAPIPDTTPSVAQLVDYLNANAQQVQMLRCDDLSIGIYDDWKPLPALNGRMVAQERRQFRMKADFAGKDQLDIGSNDQEFWFWVRQFPQPHQFFCSYQALEEGRVKVMPLPFQPDWVMETLGLSNYGPPERYQLLVEPEKFKLVEKTKSPKGHAVRKVIVFQRRPAGGTQPQITDYLLLDDATGKEICSAKVTEVQMVDPRSRAVVPRRLEIRAPEDKLKLTMKLNSVTVNQAVPATAFVRTPMPGISSFDLATGRIDGTPNSFQRVQGLH